MLQKQSGFTLIELLVALALVAALASVIGLSVNFNPSETGIEKGRVLAGLRYARGLAVSTNRSVCVVFSSNAMTIKGIPDAGSTDCSNSVNFACAVGNGTCEISGLAVGGTGTVRFDPSGRANADTTIWFTDGAQSISIVATTGYAA